MVKIKNFQQELLFFRKKNKIYSEKINDKNIIN